jgi:hypothetical protein
VVRPVDSLTREPGDAQFFHLKTTLEAHQKLATLSSNSPRAKGNIRLIGSRIPEIGAKGGRKGRNRRRNVMEVTAARRRNNAPLNSINQYTLYPWRNLDSPMSRAEVNAFCEKV